jgi:site-specific DNA recombinase
MSAHDKRDGAVRIRCTTEAESGSCGNRRRYRLDKIERAVIDGIAIRLSNPEALQAYIDGFQQERRAETKARARLERAAAEARAKIGRMARMLVDGRVPEDFFDAKMPAAREELASLEARLAAAPAEKVVTLHPAAVKTFRRAMAGLSDLLLDIDPQRDRELMDTFRALIDRVVIHDAEGGGVEVEVIGRLGPLVAPGIMGGPMVAEVRFPTLPPMTWGRFCA